MYEEAEVIIYNGAVASANKGKELGLQHFLQLFSLPRRKYWEGKNNKPK